MSDHVMVNDGASEISYRMQCDICGTVYDLQLPISIEEFLKLGKAFVILHKNCKPI